MIPQLAAVSSNDVGTTDPSFSHTPSGRPIYLTVEQFSQRNPAFTPPSLRNLIFKAEPRQSSRGEIPGNGLVEARAIIRLGRRVLIEEGRFLAWVTGQAEVKR